MDTEVTEVERETRGVGDTRGERDTRPGDPVPPFDNTGVKVTVEGAECEKVPALDALPDPLALLDPTSSPVGEPLGLTMAEKVRVPSPGDREPWGEVDRVNDS